MAKAKSPLNTPSVATNSDPTSSAKFPTVPEKCVKVSNIAVVQPSQGTAIDKTDCSSSHNISISSINEDDNNDSSAFESSDSECDDEQIKKAIERIPNSLQPGSQLVVHDNSSPVSAQGPDIGSIAVQNSSDITFGNKTYIKGQVVIKNIYHNKQNGAANQGYHETDRGLGGTAQNKDSSSKLNTLPSWQSSLKFIIRDKPILSVIIMIAVMIIITVIIIGIATQDMLPDQNPLRLVTRNEWLAQPPKEKLVPLTLPVNRVIIAHTATEGCETQTSCVYRVRFIQEQHIGINNYGDIAYNFLIGGDGNVYEGRGWPSVGAFLRGQNSKSEGVAFIGDYRHMEPTNEQMEALDALLENGVKGGYITSDFKLYGARQWQQTESPGQLLYERLQKHVHWSDDISD